jgi:O-antigen/teichoic acid export membrane protein
MYSNSRYRLDPDVLFMSDHLGNDLAQKTLRGGATTVLAQGIQFGLSTISTVILARLLAPSDFGLVGMVAAVVGFATMFKNAGLSMATIQNSRITRAQVSNLFWINVLISIALGILLIIMSPAISTFFRHSELTGISILLAISFMISGLAIQHQALLHRHMRFGSLTVILLVSQLTGLIAAIILAWLGARYWTLAWSSMVTSVMAVGLTAYFCPWVPNRMKKGTGIREMLRFGGQLTGGNVANYIAGNMDNVLVGRYLGANALGYYSRAYQMFLLPIKQIKEPLQNALLPALSSLQNEPGRYRSIYLKFLDMLATISMPISMICFLEGDLLVRVVLGPQWANAIPAFRILAVAGMIYPLAGTQGLVLVSMGRSDRFLLWQSVSAVLAVMSFIIGIPYGIQGVALAFTIMTYFFLFPSAIWCFSKTPVSAVQFFRTLSVPLLHTCAAGIAVFVLRVVLPDRYWFKHISMFILFAVLYLVLASQRKGLRESVQYILKDLLGQYAKKQAS